MRIALTIGNAADQDIGVELNTTTNRVVLTVDGAWAGGGTWDGSSIVDCSARLGADDDETQALYDKLDEALGQFYRLPQE